MEIIIRDNEDEAKKKKPNLASFSPDPKVYDFRVPSPVPDLSRLREPLRLDLELAEELHVPSLERPDEVEEKGSAWAPDWEMARRLFVSGFLRR